MVPANPSLAKPRLRDVGAGPRGAKDPCPAVVAAGYRPPDADIGAQYHLRHEDTSVTSNGVGRGRAPLGRAAKPRGGAPPELTVQGKGYGRPSGRSESVGGLLRPHDKRNEFFAERSEAVYASSKREPVGKGWVRGHHLPPRTREPSFEGFGKPAAAAKNCFDQQGQDVIQPAAPAANSETAHENYVRSHGAFAPGEQLKRRYAWPTEISRDPFHAFGGVDSGAKCRDGEGMRSVLASDGVTGADGSGGPPTRFVPKSHADWQKLIREDVGGVPGRSQLGRFVGEPPVPADFAFGTPTGGGEDNVGGLLQGTGRPEDVIPDADLGRCVRKGNRNVAVDSRAFGKPSRASSVGPFRPPPRVPPPAAGGAAPATSDPAAGDNQGAASLIAPDRIIMRGFNREEFSRPREREEIRALLSSAGYGTKLSGEAFGRVWEAARAAAGANAVIPTGGGAGNQRASLAAVINAYGAHAASVSAS